MSSLSPETTLNSLAVQTPGTCYLLKLPLELREIIYRMLLTTPYCTIPTTGFALEFHLHTAILLVNKQVSAEATRILYQENDFVIFEPVKMRLWLHITIPQFKLLSENKIKSAVLRVTIEYIKAGYAGHVDVLPSKSLITTREGLQSIIRSLWWQQGDESETHQPRGLRLTLNFHNKAVLRYQFQSEVILRPWDKLNCLDELVLTGNIKKPMREYLEKSNLEGPFPNDVAAHLIAYNSLAEQEFAQEDYYGAQWWWYVLDHYWTYVAHSKPSRLGGRRICEKGSELRDILLKSYHMSAKGRLKIVKACLRQSHYSEAARYADGVLRNIDVEAVEVMYLGPQVTPVMETKLNLSAALAQTALGKTELGMENIKLAAETLYYRGTRNLNMDLDLTELTEYLEVTVNHELIKLRSPWRCGRQPPLSPTQQSVPDWQVGVVRRSFWEWLELPEDGEVW
jgi:hypothetical protein